MTRLVHFVGSLPKELMTGYEDIMKWFVDQSRGHPLTGIPCDLDPDWVIQYLRDLHASEALEVANPGDYDGYEDMRAYRVRPGVDLQPSQVSMNRGKEIREMIDVFRELRSADSALAGARLQISQPSPLDLALFVFAGGAVAEGLPTGRFLGNLGSVIAAIRHYSVFAQAVVDEISELNGEYGDVLTWQVESPIALLGMVKAAELRAATPVAVLLARQLSDFLRQLHDIGADTSLHLCYGNYRKKELLAPKNIAPAVKILNRSARLLRRVDVPLPPVHIPCAYGASPAPRDSAFYHPLSRLDADWKVIAGVVSEESAEDSIDSLHLFEKALGRTSYGVATTCGLGRCTVDDAKKAAEATVITAGARVSSR